MEKRQKVAVGVGLAGLTTLGIALLSKREGGPLPPPSGETVSFSIGIVNYPETSYMWAASAEEGDYKDDLYPTMTAYLTAPSETNIRIVVIDEAGTRLYDKTHHGSFEEGGTYYIDLQSGKVEPNSARIIDVTLPSTLQIGQTWNSELAVSLPMTYRGYSQILYSLSLRIQRKYLPIRRSIDLGDWLVIWPLAGGEECGHVILDHDGRYNLTDQGVLEIPERLIEQYGSIAGTYPVTCYCIVWEVSNPEPPCQYTVRAIADPLWRVNVGEVEIID